MADLRRCPRKEVGHRRVDSRHEKLAVHHPLPRQGHREHPPLPKQQINEPSFVFKDAGTKGEGKAEGVVPRGFVCFQRKVSSHVPSEWEYARVIG